MPDNSTTPSKYEFAVLFVPEDSSPKHGDGPLKGSLCISPRLISGDAPAGENILTVIRDAVETIKSQKDASIKLHVGYAPNPTQVVEVALAKSWLGVWEQGNRKSGSSTLLEQLWSALVPPNLSVQPFIAETVPLVQADNAAEAHKQARAGRQAIESVSLDDLELNINSTYAGIATQLCPPLDHNVASTLPIGAGTEPLGKSWNLEDAKKSATETFRNKIGARFDDQIRRFTSIGSVRAPDAKPSETKSGRNLDEGKTKGSGDDFHEVFTRLVEFPKLMRLLGLIIDVEIKEDDLRKALKDQNPGKSTQNLFFQVSDGSQ